MLGGGDIRRMMTADEKDERLKTWKPGHNITFCPDQDKMIDTTINSVATFFSELIIQRSSLTPAPPESRATSCARSAFTQFRAVRDGVTLRE
jgi:hypothetical protein